ncbi:MAG: U32 family peptidase [Clostridiales Family XIII bacterium]|jgi:putative protease|nr:U32 family peptidase [Clostridiales Family XIII bacterium]
MEILAPVGNDAMLVAAIRAGADAVYLGGQTFHARQKASGFDEERLYDAVRLCHARGVRVYFAVNTVIFEHELSALKNMSRNAADACVDAFIVQDLAAYRMIREVCAGMPLVNQPRLHASTQMTVHNVDGLTALKNLGFSRAVLAREMHASEILTAIQSVDIETEMFVHGALCVSISGLCYMSAMIGERSANRGNCAQACRLPYSIQNPDTPMETAKYPLSLKDNCLIRHIDQIATLGVTALKIEGRLKRPEYVEIAVREYRNALSGVDCDIQALERIFSRSGFTDAYFTGNFTADAFGVRSSANAKDTQAFIQSDLHFVPYDKKSLAPTTSVRFQVSIRRDRPMTLCAIDEEGNMAEVIGATPEAAKTKGITEDSVHRSLKKLGGTEFKLADTDGIHAEIESGLFVGVADLNALRREVLRELAQKRENGSIR